MRRPRPALYTLLHFLLEVAVYVLEHFDYGEVVGAAALAHSAFNAGVRLYGHSLVAAYGPVLQAVTGEIAVDGKAEGDIYAHGAGLAVIAAAAELVAQGVAYVLHFLELLLREGSRIAGCGSVLL